MKQLGTSASQLAKPTHSGERAAMFFKPSEFNHQIIRGYPKVSGLAAWSENYKRYSSPPLDAAVSVFCDSV